MIEFSSEIGFWSSFVFWYILVNSIVCAIFTVVVIAGGIFDLRYLFRSLAEEETNDTDDGRVLKGNEEDHDHK